MKPLKSLDPSVTKEEWVVIKAFEDEHDLIVEPYVHISVTGKGVLKRTVEVEVFGKKGKCYGSAKSIKVDDRLLRKAAGKAVR